MEQTEANQGVTNSLLVSLLASLLTIAVGVVISVLVVRNSITLPLVQVTPAWPVRWLRVTWCVI